MDESLQKLVDQSREIVMTAPDRERQRRSFAYGNTHFENPMITREMIDQQALYLLDAAQSGEIEKPGNVR